MPPSLQPRDASPLKLLKLLREAGIPDRTASLTGDLLALYVGAFAYEESMPSQSLGDAEPEQIVTMIREYFASLPPERFPTSLPSRTTSSRGGPDERFEFDSTSSCRGWRHRRSDDFR